SPASSCGIQGPVFFTAKRLDSTAPGRAAHPGTRPARRNFPTPKGFYKGLANVGTVVQPLRGRRALVRPVPRVRCATRGCGVQPLPGKENEAREHAPG